MELKNNKKYRLNYSGEFCNAISAGRGHIRFGKELPDVIDAIFIGEITLSNGGTRNIFYAEFGGTNTDAYLMFSTDDPESYVIGDTDLIMIQDNIKEFVANEYPELVGLYEVKLEKVSS